MTWSGHWHGFGPWTGTRTAYGQEGARRPGQLTHDEQTRAFLAGTMPPMQVGHWLMRRDQAAAHRTWTDLSDAMDWLRKTYDASPPFERPDDRRAYIDLEVKSTYAADALGRGVDAVWVHYAKTTNLVSFSVVCCPHRFLRDLPCPLPPLSTDGRQDG